MSSRAKVLQSLYRRGKVTKEGLLRAVADGTITEDEYSMIVGDEA